MSYPGANVLIMEGATWTAIGLLGGALAAFFGGFYFFGSRIDGLGTRLDAKIESLGARLDARIDGVQTDLGGRIDALSGRVDALGADLGGRINALNARMDEHLRHTG